MSLGRWLFVLGLLVLAAPVLAETGGQAMDDSMSRHRMMGCLRGTWNQKAMVEGRLAYVKTALGITDDEAAVWKAYEDASRANEQGMEKARQVKHAALQSGSAVDRMQARITFMQARLEALKALEPAAQALYKGLTPEQQKTADTLLSMGWAEN